MAQAPTMGKEPKPKPKVLMALKDAHRQWPGSLGYPLLMGGLELVTKAAIRRPEAKTSYEISLVTVHREMQQMIPREKLPIGYRLGHEKRDQHIPSSEREEVLGIALYNELRFGAHEPEQRLPFGELGRFSALDYQVPVTRGKFQGLGCIDLLGVVDTAGGTRRPAFVELKGCLRKDFSGSGTDCPHFALLEAWIYLIVFSRNARLYREQLSSSQNSYGFAPAEMEQVAWDKPIIAIVAPAPYWSYWTRSDSERGYAGHRHFADCCILLGSAYSRAVGTAQLQLDVVGIGLHDVERSTTPVRDRNDVRMRYGRVETLVPQASSILINGKSQHLWSPRLGSFSCESARASGGYPAVTRRDDGFWEVKEALPPSFVHVVRNAIDARSLGFTSADSCVLGSGEACGATIAVHEAGPLDDAWRYYLHQVALPLIVKDEGWK